MPDHPFRHKFNQLAVFENGRTPVLLLEDEYRRAAASVSAFGNMPTAQIEGMARTVQDLLNQIVRLNYAPATGYVIEHVEGGRWRSMDTIGLADWTDDINKALCVTLREHADAFSADDPEDVRIMHVTGERHVDVTRERRIAIRGARTTIETLAHMYQGTDGKSMPLWDVAVLAIQGLDADESARQLAAIDEAVAYLSDRHLVVRGEVDDQQTIIQFAHSIEHYMEAP